jgi:hypothetical protein
VTGHDLREWLKKEPRFVAEYRAATKASICSEFPAIVPTSSADSIDWSYLLLCASVLARAEEGGAEALRIAQSCVALAPESGQRNAAVLLLDQLHNQPAVSLARKRGLVDDQSLPVGSIALKLARIRRIAESLVTTAAGVSLRLSPFQRRFWDRAKDYRWLSVSAPTSAGKSYVLKQWLGELLQGEHKLDVVYLAPTRALVQEVERDLRASLATISSGVDLCTVPFAAPLMNSPKRIFVMTQERYHLLLSRRHDSVHPALLVVDEAQKIGEGARGTLLQQVIDETLRRNSEVSVIFASPGTSNPETLLTMAPPEEPADSLSGKLATVSQNVLWASQVPRRPDLWTISVAGSQDPLPLGNVQLKAEPDSVAKKLAFIAYALGRDSPGNIIYVNGAAEAEDVAILLAQLEADRRPRERKELAQLAQLAKLAVHRRYALANVVRRGVAFHYGNMPLLLRSEIERLFASNALRYLVCTSTLIEGVNLPCKTLFARGPTKGHGKPMKLEDFWNLAGRAGRWGTEFQGNVVCIDPEPKVWRAGVPSVPELSAIQTVDTRLQNRSADLARYATGQRTGLDDIADLDALFGYAYARTRRTRELVSSLVDGASSQDIESEFARLDEGPVPIDLIERNPGIDVRGMSALLAYFGSRTRPLEELVPTSVAANDAVETYYKIFRRITKHLSPGVFGVPRHTWGCALLTVNWMRGLSLPLLIDSWTKREGAPKPPNWPVEIRRVLRDVEEVARFQAPRLLSCYVDLLRHHARALPQEGTAALSLIPDALGEYMEFGVSTKTQLSLFSLGLSRTSVVELFKKMVDDALDPRGCIAWLEENLKQIALPLLVRREVATMLDRHLGRQS